MLVVRPLAEDSTGCYIWRMASSASKTERIFKTAWFSKAARKAHIDDEELCEAISQVMAGQADDLGGGVFKKRLDKNRHRAIILAKGGRHWTFQYLFAKKDRANIDAGELDGFRKLAKLREKLTARQLDELARDGELEEICHGDEA